MTRPWLDGIEGDGARRLIETDAPVVRVVAGPGAGKTTCLKRRVQRLIENNDVAPSRIFVGTFTRAVAKELRQELGPDIEVRTLHSLATKLLRDNPAARAGLDLRFLLEYEEAAMLYDIAPEVAHVQDQRKREEALRRMQSARQERRDLPDARFAGAVERWLRAHRSIPIGEVVYRAVTGLESNDIEPGQFDHVIVDEYQDLTAAEQDLVERVWSRNGSLVVLGDNDQSIYGFRFAHPDGVDEFATRWRDNLHDVTLPENRRCGTAIVEVANQMMAEAGSLKAPMISVSGRAGRVSAVQWTDLNTEIDGLARFMVSRPEESFLVLVPRRFVGYRLRDAIGPDARTAFRQEVLDHHLVKERFALASVVAFPNDPVAVRAWLGFKGTRPELADQRNAKAYLSVARSGADAGLIRSIAAGEVRATGQGTRALTDRARQLVRLWEGEWPPEVSDQIDLIFDSALADQHEGDPEKREWLREDLTALRNAAQARASEGGSLASIIETLRYRIATRTSLEGEEDVPRIRIMTLHSAKGLQADNIIVVSAADEFMPGNSTDPNDLAEAKRLLYVALTRAKDDLIVSWARAVEYSDAKRNGVRIGIGSVQSVRGVRVVTTSRTSLLPQSLGGVVSGADWLRSRRVT